MHDPNETQPGNPRIAQAANAWKDHQPIEHWMSKIEAMQDFMVRLTAIVADLAVAHPHDLTRLQQRAELLISQMQAEMTPK